MPIKINPQFEPVALERVTHEDGTRYYVDPDGDHLTSVTTILSKTGDQSGLDQWRKRVGVVEAARVGKEASGLGTLVHTHLEAHILGHERPQGNNTVRQMANNMADQIIQYGLSKLDEVWALETMLYYPKLYAGTTDLIAVHQGTPAILDFKSSKEIKKLEYLENYRSQCAAYSSALKEVYGIETKKLVIFMVSRDMKFKEFVFEGKDYYDSMDMWIKRLDEYYSS